MLRYYESKTIAQMYAKYRVGYSDKVMETVMMYLEKKNNKPAQDKFDLMVDVGCGSGQATKLFAPYFRKAVGFDVSANQVLEANKANQMDHVTYCVGAAEKIDLPDKSVDLVISATAAHWFDLPAFFKELKRVLKTDGCLALLCYHDDKLTQVERENTNVGFAKYYNEDILIRYVFEKGVYNTQAKEHILGGYRKIFDEIPSNDKERNDTNKNHYDCTLEQVAGLLYSCDSIQNHMEAKVKEFEENYVIITDELLKSVDLVEQFRSEIRNDWNIADDQDDCDVKINIDADVYILMACHLE